MSLPSFMSELKRRQIYRGGVMYIVAGWVVVQVAATVFPYFNIPGWAIRLLVVVILLGFPVALVGLWMFESRTDPDLRLQDRRRGGDSRDAVVQLLEAERSARERENRELIAALAELRSVQAGAPPLAEPAASPDLAPAAGAVADANASTTVPPRRTGSLAFLSFVAMCLLASVAWQLLLPDASMQTVAASGEIAQDLVVPGFRQLERFAVRLIAPVLHKLGLGIAPETVFIGILVLLGLLVLRDFYRQCMELLARRRARAQ